MDYKEAFFEDSPYEVIKFAESLDLNVRHAAHCILYSLNSYPVTRSYESKAYLSMHFRTDGRLGTPGGYIDKEEGTDIVRGLNRELVEEYGLREKYFVTEKDHFLSCINKDRTNCYHCFEKEVSVDEFKEIERDALHGSPRNSVLGVVRVPLFTVKDGYRGFPAFLSNRFSGSCKYALLNFLLNKKIMSHEEIRTCLSKSLLVKM